MGERGVGLSGGQKQRISIARALYSDSDIFVIDDALSALDAYVGEKIMKNVFLEKLKHKTRIMVTHKLKILSVVDRIIIMQDLRIAEDGPYEQIAQKKLFKEINVEIKQQTEDIEKALDPKPEPAGTKSKKRLPLDGKRRTDSMRSCDSRGSTMKEEARKIGFYGVISDGDLMSYCLKKILGRRNMLKTFFFYILYSIWTIVVNKWLGKWSKNEFQFSNMIWYPIIFFILNLLSVAIFGCRIYFFTKMTLHGAKRIFNKLIARLLKKPLSFFEKIPSGEIIQRCINDTNAIDTGFPMSFSSLLNTLFLLLSSYTLMVYLNYLNIVLVVGSVLYGWTQLKRFFKT